MSSASLLKILREQRSNVVTVASQMADAYGSDRVLDSGARVALEQHFSDLDVLDERIERMTRAAMAEADAEKRSSNYVYTRGGQHSWLLDKINAVRGQRDARAARARLDQHDLEVRRELRNIELARESVFSRAATDGGWNVERRALSTTAGVGGEFSPPLWAIQSFGHLPRAASPLLNLIDVMPLPRGVLKIDVPKITGGAGVGTTQQNSAATANDATTSYSESIVQTITSRMVISQQLMDQANQGAGRGIDEVFFEQLQDDFSAKLESQLLTGVGPGSNQLTGLMNITGTNSVVYTSGSPTGGLLSNCIGEAGALISDTRLRAPGCVIMSGRRWFWLSSQTDSSNRPLGNIGAGNMVDPTGSDAGPFGPIHGLGVFLDGALPTTLGAGGNQDVVIVTRPRDLLVWQTTPILEVHTGTYADSMGVELIFRSYVAAVLDLYPTATSIVTGTGLTAPAGF
jgi:HK97 family phage major capsid protein